MDWTLQPRRAADIEIAEVTDGYVASRADGARIHYLNPSAALILEVCDGSLPASELPALLASAFELAEPPVADVEACLAAFIEEGLLLISHPAPSRSD
jgi:hypothetical protein